MPTLSKTWQFDIARVNPQGTTSATATVQYLVWYIKAFLMGQIGGATQGLWTMYQSCDSTAYGSANDGVDRWTDYTKVVNASTAHSWCILKSPTFSNGQVLYLILNTSATTTGGAGSTPTSFQLYLCKTPPTGGTTTVSPTIPGDAFPVVSNAAYGTVDGENTAAARHLCAGLTSDGATWYFVQSKDGDGFARTVVIFSLLTNAKANDLFPYWLYQYYDATTSGGARDVDLNTVRSPPAGAGRTWNGSAANNVIALIPYATSYYVTNAAVTNAVDPADSTWFDFPLWVGFTNSPASSVVAGGAQFKGTVPDFALGPTQCPQGSVDGAPGSITSMFLGNLWFPSNATPTL